MRKVALEKADQQDLSQVIKVCLNSQKQCGYYILWIRLDENVILPRGFSPITHTTI